MDPIRHVLENTKTIAVVGATNNPARPCLGVSRYMQERGYKIIPVNPREQEFLGQTCYADLISVPFPVDLVDIFRNPEAVPEIIEQAIAIGAKAVWMQPGAENMQAAERAMQAGLEVIMGVCIMVEHRVLSPARASS